jgi:hypothetical protein
VRFKLSGLLYSETGATREYPILLEPPTGVANINDRVKTTFGPNSYTTTEQGSGNLDLFGGHLLDIDMIACKYKFIFAVSINNSVLTYSDIDPIDSVDSSVGTLYSGFYPIPITSSTLSGSANFPVFYPSVMPSPLPSEYCFVVAAVPGVVAYDAGGDMGSASVTWEFKPVLTTGGLPTPTPTPIPTGTIAGNVTNASAGKPIAGATVNAGIAAAKTDINGNYSIKIASGTYNVKASASGYADKTSTITVPPATKVIMNFALQPIGGDDSSAKAPGFEVIMVGIGMILALALRRR